MVVVVVTEHGQSSQGGEHVQHTAHVSLNRASARECLESKIMSSSWMNHARARKCFKLKNIVKVRKKHINLKGSITLREVLN